VPGTRPVRAALTCPDALGHVCDRLAEVHAEDIPGIGGAPAGLKAVRVDVPNSATADGTQVDIWDCNGGANQEWDLSNGTITGVQSGLCLEVTGGRTADGALGELWDCNGGSNQQWTGPSSTGEVHAVLVLLGHAAALALPAAVQPQPEEEAARRAGLQAGQPGDGDPARALPETRTTGVPQVRVLGGSMVWPASSSKQVHAPVAAASLVAWPRP